MLVSRCGRIVNVKRAFLFLIYINNLPELCDAEDPSLEMPFYNFNAHQQILVIFGRDAAERICYRMVI